jgi:hypothetical protein
MRLPVLYIIKTRVNIGCEKMLAAIDSQKFSILRIVPTLPPPLSEMLWSRIHEIPSARNALQTFEDRPENLFLTEEA